MIETATGNVKLSEFAASLRQKYTLNRKVLFVQSPQFLFDSLNIEIIKNRGYYAYPPAGLQCLTRALSGRDLEIRILDLNYQFLKRVISDASFECRNWLDILDEYLYDYRPSIVGVTAISVYGDVFKPTFPLTSILERLRDRDDCIVIAGGPTATNETAAYLEGGFCHFAVEGEGENKINFLFDHLFNCRQMHKPAPGIFFRLNEKIECTEGEKDTVALKGNLVDTYGLVPVEDYSRVGCLNPFSRMAGQDRPFAGIQLHRGCRASCKFCGVTEFMGRGLRRYPVRDVLEEIRYLVKERGIRHFEVLDDDFLGTSGPENTTAELLKGMVEIRQHYGITWAAGNGLIAASLNEELLSLMRDSGCVGFRIGIESGDEEMQKRMKKPVSLPVLRKAGEMLQKFPELFVAGNYIIGFFGRESFGQMLETFKFSCEMNLDGANFAVFQFTGRAVLKQSAGNRRMASEFTPSKDDARGEILESEGIISGPEVFNISKDSIPSPEQIKQIWFSFNLVANYINNKNLKPAGNPEKITLWIEAVRLAYPKNPYMSLFAGLGRIMLGDRNLAHNHLENTRAILNESKYWRQRFLQFALMPAVDNFPDNAALAYEILGHLRNWYSKWSLKFDKNKGAS